MKKAIIFAAIFTASFILPVHASPTAVSYTATKAIYYSDGVSSSFNISAAVQLQASFDCSTENTTCHINASRITNTLNITYDVIVLSLESKGSWSVPTPTVLGDSPDYSIPSIPISFSIHANITGKPNPNIGTANPSLLTWTAWGNKDTNISAEATSFSLNTTYSFFMTITFNLVIPITQNSTAEQAQGIPTPVFPIPELPSILLTLFAATTAILLLRAAVPKFHGSPKSKSPLSACDNKAHPTRSNN
jgi:hypothetical protein